MADEDDFEADTDEPASAPEAAAVALALDAPNSPDASTFLRKQSRMLDMQMQTMRDQEALHMSHLRWRRFADRMRGLTWMLGLFVGAIVVAGFIALIWNAHEAHGLVVQPLRTPPDLAAKGLDGTVLAQRLLDKLNGLVAESDAAAYRSADTISG